MVPKSFVATSLGALFLSTCEVTGAATPPRDAPTAETRNGSYYGIHNSVYNQDLGILYAQPPVKEFRFAVPRTADPSYSQQRPDESWDEGLKEVGWLFIESKRTSRPSAVFSPLDNGWDDKLFHAAIRQSCSLTGLGLEGPSIERFSIATGNITATLCTNATDKLACFKKASFETLKNAINATLSLPVAGPVYGPVVDGNISLYCNGASAIFAGTLFKEPTRYGAQLWKQHGFSNIYVYEANTTLSGGPIWLGVARGFELPYMFYDLNGTGWSGMWMSFLNSGIPYYKNLSDWNALN
ncbi:hypothetical protein H9L39_20286 [Fusarium oxysporum f. sp. albedinis]|nr:hypothetical protein H9L39_20286 [Fusarium oxysporum f. sp. albedinis]